MTVADTQPLIFWENVNGNISDVWFIIIIMKRSTRRRWRDLIFILSAYVEGWHGMRRPEGMSAKFDRCRSPRGQQWYLYCC